ncbi:MAG: Ger(x)C family spore germination protein [Turicibacter sp.]
MKKVILFCACFFILTGCGNKIEIPSLGIVSGIGIDKTEKGFLITAQIVNPDYVAGNKTNKLPVFVIQGEGESIFQAYRMLNTLTTKVVFLPHLDVMVVSEELAKEGINDILDFALRNVKIRPDVNILVAKDVTAADVMQVLDAGTTIPDQELNTISGICASCESVKLSKNLYDVANLIQKKGANLVVNAVTITGDVAMGAEEKNIELINSPAKLETKELAAFNEDKFVGFLNYQESKAYNIMNGESRKYVISTKVEDKYLITFEARKNKVEIKTDLDQKKITVNCELTGALMDMTYPIDLEDPLNIKKVATYLEEQLKKELIEITTKSTDELKTDLFSVGDKIYHEDPKKWKEIESDWKTIYPELTYDITVKVTINDVGDITNLK